MNDKNEIKLITKLLEVDCQILKTGYKFVEVEYFKCSCYEDEKNPICQGCAETCHQNHQKTKWPSKKEVCHCGLNNHIVEDIDKPDEGLSKKCIFSDISTSTYFSTGDGKKLCLYCKEFCVGEEEKATISCIRSVGKKIPPCECKKHQYLKDFYKNLNDLAIRSKQIDLGEIDLLRFFNLFLGNDKCFKLLYKEFIKTHEKLKEEFEEPGYSLEASLVSGSYFLSVQNFAIISKNIKYLNYFSDKLSEYFDFKFVYKLMICEFDVSKKNLWELKNNVLLIFRKIFVQKLFSFSPFLKIRDIENLDPLQRLAILTNIKDNENIRNLINDKEMNFIDSILKLINKCIEIKGKTHKVCFELLRNLYSICKVFAKLNLFSTEQIHKFCSLNDEMIYSFTKNKANIKNYVEERMKLYISCESELLIPAIKSVIFFVFYNNDTQIYNYLKDNNIALEEIAFYHSQNDNVKFFVRNNVNLSNYIKNYYHILNNSTSIKSMKKLLSHSLHLTSISTIKDDNYLLGLRRIFDKNKEFNLNYIIGVFTPEERRFYAHLQTQTTLIEDSYQSFYNSKLTEKELAEVITKSINDLFEEIGLSNYEPDIQESLANNKKGEPDNKNNYYIDSKSENKDYIRVITQFNPHNSNEISFKRYKFKLLINMSLYIFTVIKSVKILNLSRKNESEKGNFKEELFKDLFRILFFISEDDPDNCMILIMSEIIYLILYLKQDQLLDMVKLIYNCLFNIKKYSYHLTSSRNIFKFIRLTLDITKVKIFLILRKKLKGD